MLQVLDELEARLVALERRNRTPTLSEAKQADIVRPPGHPLGQSGDYTDSFDGMPELRCESERQGLPKRHECWLLVSPAKYGLKDYYSQRPGMSAMGWTEHHLVELREGDVVLSRERAKWILRSVQGGPVDPEDIRALEGKP